jgi:hypothetical protein
MQQIFSNADRALHQIRSGFHALTTEERVFIQRLSVAVQSELHNRKLTVGELWWFMRAKLGTWREPFLAHPDTYNSTPKRRAASQNLTRLVLIPINEVAPERGTQRRLLCAFAWRLWEMRSAPFVTA